MRKIDPELQVTTCAHGETIKVIVFYNDKDKCREAIEREKLNITADISLINAFVVEISYPKIYNLAEDKSVQYVSANLKVKTLMNISGKVVGARLLNSVGLTGKNVGIAVLDTGIYPHVDFTRPKNRIKAFADFVSNFTTPYDDNGHGTYVAGIAAGNGLSSRGLYRGVAPDADIIAVKSMNSDGGGDTSNILKGLQWVNDNREKYNIKILTLAFGADVRRFDREDALVKAVNKLWDRGVTVVVAAGNSGPAQRTINTPGISPKVITVGSTDDKRTLTVSDDVIANFSSRGPVSNNNIKPDIVAPGVDVISLASNTAFVPGKRIKGLPGHTSMSGTSVSTPIVAGMCALLLESNPTLTPDAIKTILKKNTINITYDVNSEGSGLLHIR
ncbi:MAG TPA: S8 family peptidase [Clostridia bacterium]|nr:S8 family peptidase [Clostridia bacterium]